MESENEWLETVCPDCLQKYKTSYQCLRIGGKQTNFEHRCLDYKTLEDIDKELEYQKRNNWPTTRPKQED